MLIQSTRDAIRRFVMIVALAFWQGGLTFYAVVVVPVGNSILTGGEQGFVTQQVTRWLNWTGVAVLIVLLANAPHLRDRAYWLVWSIMAAAHIGLFAVHALLDGVLDPAKFQVLDRDRFEPFHDGYLVLVTIQWCASLVALWLILNRQGRRPAGAGDLSPPAD